ncbi:MAG: carbohydrate-binding protein [Eubacteriales bacterium]|jgi:hypothetical protein
MKKAAVIILAALIALTTSLAASAKYDAFSKIEVTPDVHLIDDDTTQEQGGSGNPIQYVEGYGVGYSSLNDIVYFPDVDFGENGAKQMTIFFSYGHDDGSATTLDVYIDDYENSEPVCSFEIGFTGGWESTFAQEITADCNIPGGVHTVYVQFTNDRSGSFTYITFTEADPVELPEPETTEDIAEEAPVVAAETFDPVVATAAIAAASAALIATLSKKNKSK